MGKPKGFKKGKAKKDIEKDAEIENSHYDQNQSDTVFIRNLSFDTEEDTLKEFIEENFGKTVYCLVCRDKETDESKGTAFARFADPEDAQKCLKEFRDREQQTKFHLTGRNLIVLPAISRDKVKEVTQKKESKKDKRNLELAKEGFIHHLSDEAKDLSKGDLEKRKALNTRKRELLKNLHNFVSDTRLCIHNLPPSIDDQKLRHIFLNSVSEHHPDAKIVECRVMRNKKGSGQLGTSKGFGFVAFSKHEHALSALKATNNNPKIFARDKRPIVEFSIENLVALNKKKTRLVNSVRKNQADKNSQPSTKPPDKVAKKKELTKKMKVKKLKRKGTVTSKDLDQNEGADILRKIQKVKKQLKIE